MVFRYLKDKQSLKKCSLS